MAGESCTVEHGGRGISDPRRRTAGLRRRCNWTDFVYRISAAFSVGSDSSEVFLSEMDLGLVNCTSGRT